MGLYLLTLILSLRNNMVTSVRAIFMQLRVGLDGKSITLDNRNGRELIVVGAFDNCGEDFYPSAPSVSYAYSLLEDLASWRQYTDAAAQQTEVKQLMEQAILEKAVSPISCTGKGGASIFANTLSS
jgi:hypothetical protein